MKTILFYFIFMFVLFQSFGQDSTRTPVSYKNEFGIDATGFFRQFINKNTDYFSGLYLTYRRHFKPGNIRSGIGFDFQSNSNRNMNTDFVYSTINVQSRIGWEWYSTLTKRWQVYYGIDFRTNIGYDRITATYSKDVKNERIRINQGYGLGPVLGFRYKFSPRLSLVTETSLSVFYSQFSTEESYKNYDDETKRIYYSGSVYSSFTAPLSVFITFDI